jgi:hypothetical protein
MTTPKEHASLAAALVAFQSELPKVPKDKTAKMGTYSYTYTDLATLTHTVLPLLTRHGLSFTAGPRFNVEGGGYELAGQLLHTSGESVEGALPLHGRTPQEIGSAVTYARRYIFGCLTGVVSEDDNDAQVANQAPRTEPAVDWDSLADTAESLFDLAELKDLWTRHNLAKAPKVIQDRVKAHVDVVKGQTT